MGDVLYGHPLPYEKRRRPKSYEGSKKSGLKAVTLIATPNPVSQVLW